MHVQAKNLGFELLCSFLPKWRLSPFAAEQQVPDSRTASTVLSKEGYNRRHPNLSVILGNKLTQKETFGSAYAISERDYFEKSYGMFTVTLHFSFRFARQSLKFFWIRILNSMPRQKIGLSRHASLCCRVLGFTCWVMQRIKLRLLRICLNKNLRSPWFYL